MREIKFRAWYEKSQTWVYLTLGHLWTNNAKKIYIDLCIDGTTFYEYTGLKDKNGKEIYEGDILHFGRYVVNEIGEDSMEYVDVRVDWDYELLCEFKYDCEDENNFVEIIGNVHENPELL